MVAMTCGREGCCLLLFRRGAAVGIDSKEDARVRESDAVEEESVLEMLSL
jgi:hypothetical protein